MERGVGASLVEARLGSLKPDAASGAPTGAGPQEPRVRFRVSGTASVRETHEFVDLALG